MELTDRIRTSDASLKRIEQNGSSAAAKAFEALTKDMGRDQTLVACWTKANNSRRSVAVANVAALSWLVRGFREGGCRELTFFAQLTSSVSRAHRTYPDLFK